MATTNPVPAPKPLSIKIQQTVLNGNLDDVTIGKEVPFTPASSAQEVLGLIGDNQEVFLKLLNDGLKEHVRENAKNDASGWFLMEEGEITEQIAQNISTVSDPSAVKKTINTLAQSGAGEKWKVYTPEQKSLARQAVKDLAKANPAILAMLTGGMASGK